MLELTATRSRRARRLSDLAERTAANELRLMREKLMARTQISMSHYDGDRRAQAGHCRPASTWPPSLGLALHHGAFEAVQSFGA